MQKLVVITGASSGIGEAIAALLFLREKYHVINISKETSKFDDLLCDISNSCDVDITIDHLYDYLGDQRISYLINNAGIMPLESDSVELYKRVMNTNLQGAYQLSIRLADWIDDGIINIASISGLGPATPEDSIAYGVSKAGVISLTKYLAIKYPNLCVNSISPGFIEPTNLVPGDTPQHLIDGIPKKREGNVLEVAELVNFLMHQTYITGQNIAIDGGLSL